MLRASRLRCDSCVCTRCNCWRSVGGQGSRAAGEQRAIALCQQMVAAGSLLAGGWVGNAINTHVQAWWWWLSLSGQWQHEPQAGICDAARVQVEVRQLRLQRRSHVACCGMSQSSGCAGRSCNVSADGCCRLLIARGWELKRARICRHGDVSLVAT
jgi:hypothetical protein